MSYNNQNPTRGFGEWDEEEPAPKGITMSPIVLVLIICIAIVAIILAFFIGRSTAPAPEKADSSASAQGKASDNKTKGMSEKLKQLAKELPTGGKDPYPSVTGQDHLDLIKTIQAASDPKRTMGPKDAKLKVIEYSDYSCPMCTRAHKTLDPIFMKLAQQGVISFEVRDLNIFAGKHRSDLAAAAALAAADQNKFWEFRAAVFDAAGSGHPDYTVDSLVEIAKQVGIPDLQKFRAGIKDPKNLEHILKESQQAQQWGMQGTPAIFIGNAFVPGALSPEEINATIIEQLKEAGY